MKQPFVKQPKVVTHGFLGGDSMSIAWTLFEPHRDTLASRLDLAIEFTPDPKGETFTLAGQVVLDAVVVARAVDPSEWNKVLVESSRLIVADAATRDARLRAGVNATGGAS